MNRLFLPFFLLLSTLIVGQTNFTEQDSLRGSITKERAWWDVQKYTLDVKVFPETKTIKGSNLITYKVLKPSKTLQIELQSPLVIDSIIQNHQKLNYAARGYSYFINLQKEQLINTVEQLQVYYHGKPKEAKQAPWDGGFVWDKDKNQQHFIATANQSIGPSIWWPCKDHPYDEANAVQITVTCPNGLMDVSNGKNIKVQQNKNQTTSYTWEVTNPINNYGVAVNIADYAHFNEIYKGIEGDLSCNYYVLKENLQDAKKHFVEVPKTLEAFEYWLGAYPFYKDGYKIVETPYLGMEHQSCVAYGNKYLKGYLGHSMGRSGWAKKFDFIIVHETGHEWFANSITCKDVADLWIHEAFTSYAESLFLDYHFGTQAANEYVQGIQVRVFNDRPILGVFDRNHEGSSDMYFKGSLMLHTLRQMIDDDVLWRKMLQGLNKEFYHKVVTGKEIIDYLDDFTKIDLDPFFEQYLTTTDIPELEIKQQGEKMTYTWNHVVDGFEIPLKIFINENPYWITPEKGIWKQLKGNVEDFSIDPNYYVFLKK